MKISWSVISIISRFTAVGIGLIQSIFIAKLLSLESYGLVGLVASIAAVVGVYQNLGISSGSTREIAATDNLKDAFKVFVGSAMVRYAISLPLVVGLFVMAPYLGNVYYHRPAIIYPLRLFALVLFIQSLQSVLNSLVQGLKRFKFLFTFQALIALLSISVFIPMVYYYGFIGYFYAMLTFNVVSTSVLLVYAVNVLKGNIVFPTKSELKRILTSVFSIGVFVYIIKIVLIQWQKLGPIVLAKVVDDSALATFTFALLVSSKVSVISDAITDITLPSMTKVYEKSKDKFKEEFLVNNSKAYMLILFASVMLVLLKRESFMVLDYLFAFVGKENLIGKFSTSFYIMDPLILGFWAYSHLNLLKSGVSVPSRKMFGALISFVIMLGSTFALYNILGYEPVFRFALSMGLGALTGYLSLIVFIRYTLGFYPITKNDLLYTLLSLMPIYMYFKGFSHIITSVLFVLTTLVYYKFFVNEKIKA